MNQEREKMKIVADTHTHTIVSGHAYSTIKEMIEFAEKAELEVLALTEHAPRLPGAPHEFYFSNYRVLPKKKNNLHILYGAEINILDETGAVDLNYGLCREMDIVVASIHTPEACYGESKGIVKNTQAYVNAMKHEFVHVIGHPDDTRIPVDYETLVLAAKEHNVLLEVNNSSLEPTSFRERARENQLEYLELCKKHQVKIATGSDAHVDLHVGNFRQVKSVLEEIAFPEELVITTNAERLLQFLGK